MRKREEVRPHRTAQHVCPPHFPLPQTQAVLRRFTILPRIQHTILFARHLIIYSFYRGKKLVQRIVFRHYSCIKGSM